MLNGKYISIKQILEELYADNGYQYEIPWGDAMMWAEEALNLIGHPRQYIRKIIGHKQDDALDVTAYKVKLPCDFHQLEMLAVNGFPARYSGNAFHHLLSGDCCDISNIAGAIGTEYKDNFGNIFDPSLSNYPYNAAGDITFDLNNEYLTLSVEEGKVCLAYLAFPTDDEGLPMIPDDVSYKQAVKKYLTMKIDYIEWRRGTLNPQVYQHSEREWEWYCGQASNKAKDPGLPGMESIKNQIIRLRPEINAGTFKYLGTKEIRKTH